jgi:lipoprotein-anchoring transpeptidase ErfK/SrfK
LHNPSDTAYPHIAISLAEQRLRLVRSADDDGIDYPVSTALNGAGEADGSGCTPRGRHYVRAAIGDGCVPGTVFVARRPTGEIWSPQMAALHPDRDWILTRILWLCGLEWGKNRGPGVDTFRRFIYIHGTPDTEPMGRPESHGCIRMRNTDILDLFSRVVPGTGVDIA